MKPATILDEFAKRVPNIEKYFVDWNRNSLFIQTKDKRGLDYKISDIISAFQNILNKKRGE